MVMDRMEQFFNAGKKANAAARPEFRDKIRSFARIRYDKRCEGRYTRSGTQCETQGDVVL